MNKRKAPSGERIEKKQSEVKQQKIKEIEAQKENNRDKFPVLVDNGIAMISNSSLKLREDVTE